ncbi:recombinase family protein [Agromyces allii]|uniref:Recombinase family protein n=1 Tax=Agromyces allii TaxID=393607 RepID=A0ABN2QGM3_9MICO|nr:recombinase family protein [Agromyces allii]
MTLRAAIYVRQSVNHAEGIDRAVARCERLVEARGWTLVDTFKDNDVSASKSRASTRWADLLDEISTRRVNVVVGIDVDRLVRSIQDIGTLIDLGVRVLTVDGEIDLTTADGEFRATMLAAIARFEVRRKGERQKRANEYRASTGRPTPGRRRYGYESDGITARESEAAVVRRMFAHIADGGSIRSIALALRNEGVDPAPGRSWSTGRVRYIVQNPTYGGYVVRKGEATPSDVVAAIVDPELAAEARAVLADESRRTTPGPTPRHLGSGIAACGAPDCAAFLMNLAGAYRCKLDSSHPTITKDRLDTRLRREVARAFLELGDAVGGESAPSRRIAPLVEALTRNEAAAKATVEDRDEGLLPAAAARERLVELRSQREAIEADIEAARSDRSASAVLAEAAREALAGVPSSFSMSAYADMVDAVASRFAALELDRQREVVRALLDVTVHPGRDARRVEVWHLAATRLNPDYVDAATLGLDEELADVG